jgi:hypothetical protein
MLKKIIFQYFVHSEYDNIVKPPEGEKLNAVMKVYESMGLPGCIGSIDCVHIQWDKCPVKLHHLCFGKEKYPTLAYEVVVDHNRRIQACTRSFWGARNDKTIVKYDRFVTNIHNKATYHNIVTYKLKDINGHETNH